VSQVITSKCKVCRRLGVKLFLKGERCLTKKCAVERKQTSSRGRRPRRMSEYGRQLREKQKLRYQYRLSENQFAGLFHKAERLSGVTSEDFLRLLERRLDNVVYRLGLCQSRGQARELVAHGHFQVNGRKVDIPSYLVKEGDVITPRPAGKKLALFKDNMAAAAKKDLPEWLGLDRSVVKGQVKRFPYAEELVSDVDVSAIVEFYSK